METGMEQSQEPEVIMAEYEFSFHVQNESIAQFLQQASEPSDGVDVSVKAAIVLTDTDVFLDWWEIQEVRALGTNTDVVELFDTNEAMATELSKECEGFVVYILSSQMKFAFEMDIEEFLH